MKIAVISDIHSNLYALMEVLQNIDEQGVDTIICLGDLVGYGPHPNEVINVIKRRGVLCLKGNYDASVVENRFSYIRETSINSFSLPWTVEELRESNKYYLDSLPESLTLKFFDKTLHFVHGSPRKINEYMYEKDEATEEIMNSFKEDMLICAHTHLPCIKHYGDKILLNDGSVGKPKIGRPNATYALIEIYKDSPIKAEIKEVPYNYSKTVKDMQMKKFPEILISSYRSGIE